jgi:hypothetical protein
MYSRVRSTVLYANRWLLVMRKGEITTVLSNRGEQSGRRFGARVVGLVPGVALVDVLRCRVELVDTGGGLSVVVEWGLPKVGAKSNAYDKRIHGPLLYPTPDA